MSIEKVAHDRRPLTVRPNSTLSGHTFLMRRLSARDWMLQRRGEMDEASFLALALDAIEDHSLPTDDVGAELDMDEAASLLKAWVAAHTEDAVPPTSGEE